MVSFTEENNTIANEEVEIVEENNVETAETTPDAQEAQEIDVASPSEESPQEESDDVVVEAENDASYPEEETSVEDSANPVPVESTEAGETTTTTTEVADSTTKSEEPAQPYVPVNNTPAPAPFTPLPFTYTQTNGLVKLSVDLPKLSDEESAWDEDNLDVDLNEDNIVVKVEDTEDVIFSVNLVNLASTISSSYKVKDGKLKFKLRKQHEGSKWTQVFSNGFSYTTSQEFPSVVEDFDLNDLQVLTADDIVLKEQLPPMTGELEPLRDTILRLLVVYENLRRDWLRENQESLKKSREAALEQMKEQGETDLAAFTKKLWLEASNDLKESASNQEKLLESFEKAKIAADFGYPEALEFVGTAYTTAGDSYGVEKDLELATKYFKIGAFQHERLQSLLPLIQLEEEAAKNDPFHLEVVKALYLKAAQLGHPTAFFKLGVILHGEYDSNNIKGFAYEAIEWWKLSLRRGHSLSARNIGSIYMDLKNNEYALEYYTIGNALNDQITIPSQLLQKTTAVADPDTLLEEVLMTTSAHQDISQSISSTTSASSLDASKDSGLGSSTVSTTPTTKATDDILSKLEKFSTKSSRMTPKRPFSDSQSPSTISPYFRYEEEEEEEEDEEVLEPNFLWKASTWLASLAVSGGAFYVIKKFLVPPSTQVAAPQTKSVLPPSILNLK